MAFRNPITSVDGAAITGTVPVSAIPVSITQAIDANAAAVVTLSNQLAALTARVATLEGKVR